MGLIFGSLKCSHFIFKYLVCKKAFNCSTYSTYACNISKF